MGIETGTKIADLNALWPLGSDPKSQGDDHLRLIKSILQSDAPSLADGGAFLTNPTVPDGATGKEAVNADDVPGLAGTGPVEIAAADAVAGWQVWGDLLIQWGRETTLSGGAVAVNFAQAFKSSPSVTATVAITAPLSITDQYVAMIDQFPTTTGFVLRQRYQSEPGTGQATDLPVDWIAIGEAPDNLKKAKTVQTVGAAEDAPQNGNTYGRKDGAWEQLTEISEFHDATGVASWKVVGNTLECWGKAVGSTTNLTVNLPKTYANTTYAINVTNGTSDGDMGAQVINESSFTAVSQNSNADRYWHTIGQWDGN